MAQPSALFSVHRRGVFLWQLDLFITDSFTGRAGGSGRFMGGQLLGNFHDRAGYGRAAHPPIRDGELVKGRVFISTGWFDLIVVESLPAGEHHRCFSYWIRHCADLSRAGLGDKRQSR